MTEIKLTKEQKQAIYDSGQNILVSASAGSGKTFVMIERIINKIRQGISIKDLFISTFTVKAAEELKTRLDKKLKAERRNTSDIVERQKFTRALQELENAHIGTTDSYTNFLLKEYYYTIDLDPNFRLMVDKAEQDLLKEEVFNEMFESYLAEDEKIEDSLKVSTDNFTALSKNYSNDRNTNGFREVIYQIHSFAESTENPLEWLKNDFLTASKLYKSSEDLPSDLIDDVKSDLYMFICLMETSSENGLFSGKAAKENSENFLAQAPLLLKLLEERQIAKFAEEFSAMKLDFRFGKSKDEVLVELQNEFKKVKSALVGSPSSPGSIRKFTNSFKHANLIEEYSDMSYQLMQDLQKVSIYFYKIYLERKLQENTLEYADINHLALKILKENEEIRLHFVDKYNEVMIDEYQDANRVQEALYQLISNGHNLFMVGDIKQSIYSFRQADSQLFLSKYIAYQSDDADGELIRLKENFRSRTEVLNFTNNFFESIMDKNLGEMEYGSEEKLVFGSNEFPKDEEVDSYPELLLFYDKEAGSYNTDENEFVSQNELLVTSEKIKELVKSGVKYDDIVILVRSKSHNNEIEDTLTNLGIPIVLDEGRNNYLESMEVKIMLETLRAIDNPLQDVSFVALINSPMFNFNEDDLMRISLQDKKLPFYRKYQLALNGLGQKSELVSSSLRQKLEDFNDKFSNWIEMANKVSLHNLIWKIYQDTYYYEYVGAMNNGALRQANLQALSTRANDFENNGYKGLYRFVKMIDNFLEQNNDLASVNVELPENAVRVMTIHKSKGLEFDYVFLLNLQVKFQQRDLTSKLILSRENGAGTQMIVDMKDRVETDFPYALVSMETVPYIVNRNDKLKASLSEEMRVLYVAFTRAVKKLYMVGSVKGKTPFAKYDNSVLEDGMLDVKSRKNAKSYQDWLLSLLSAKEEENFTDALESKEFISNKLKLAFKLFDNEMPIIDEQPTIPDQEKNQVFEEFKEEITIFDNETIIADKVREARRILDSTDEVNSKYAKAIELPTIQTPSQIKKRYEKIIDIDGITQDNSRSNGKFELSRSDSVSAAELGSATHELMQQVNLDDTSMEGLTIALQKVSARNSVKEKINLEKISNFFDTELGKLMIDNQDKLTREAPFSMLKTDSESKEQYLIRGIVDGFLKFDDKIILFDYKTDRFTRDSQVLEIEKRYEVQMNLYAEALTMSYGVDQIEKYLILLGGTKGIIVRKLP